jgi:hypothetical protein
MNKTYLNIDFRELEGICQVSTESLNQKEVEILFKDCLKNFDKNYIFLSDLRAYRKGKAQEEILVRATKRHTFLKTLLDNFYNKD